MAGCVRRSIRLGGSCGRDDPLQPKPLKAVPVSTTMASLPTKRSEMSPWLASLFQPRRPYCSSPPPKPKQTRRCPLASVLRVFRLLVLSRLGLPRRRARQKTNAHDPARPSTDASTRAHFFPHYLPSSLAFSRAAIAPPPWLMRFGHRRRLVKSARMPAAGCRGKPRSGQGGGPCSSPSSGSLPPQCDGN